MFEKPTVTIQKTDKPWGYELLWAKTDTYVAKLLFVKKGESLSLQYHREKEETLYLQSGECWIESGWKENALEKWLMKPGEAFHIKPGYIHRMEAKTDATFFEVSTPQLSDVVRLQDRYGRAGK